MTAMQLPEAFWGLGNDDVWHHYDTGNGLHSIDGTMSDPFDPQQVAKSSKEVGWMLMDGSFVRVRLEPPTVTNEVV